MTQVDVDDIERVDSLDIQNYQILNESGDKLFYEYTSNSSIILESFNVSDIDELAQNRSFETEGVGILDFSERNPFGDY